MELIMIRKSTNLYKRIKVSYCYRWSLDRGLVFICGVRTARCCYSEGIICRAEGFGLILATCY